MAMTQDEVVRKLEELVDATDLANVLICLGIVCVEKSEHVLINWQDKALARTWDNAHRACMRASESPSVAAVSK